VGITGTALSGATVVVNANGRLGVVASSARYKQGIEPLGDASSMAERLQQLRPVSFRYKAEPEATHYPNALRHEVPQCRTGSVEAPHGSQGFLRLFGVRPNACACAWRSYFSSTQLEIAAVTPFEYSMVPVPD
jgi:hypothetical protein